MCFYCCFLRLSVIGVILRAFCHCPFSLKFYFCSSANEACCAIEVLFVQTREVISCWSISRRVKSISFHLINSQSAFSGKFSNFLGSPPQGLLATKTPKIGELPAVGVTWVGCMKDDRPSVPISSVSQKDFLVIVCWFDDSNVRFFLKTQLNYLAERWKNRSRR